MWSDCLLDLGADFLVGNMVIVGNAQYLAVEHHFHGLYSFLELCCEGHNSRAYRKMDVTRERINHGTEKNTPVIPHWFQSCQCCCCLCYPGEYLRLGTPVSFS